MTPVEVVEDMLRQINVASWTAETAEEQARALLCKLAEFSRLYGHSRLCSTSGVRLRSMQDFEQGVASAKLQTPLKLLRAMGLRIRIERDPNPRHLLLRPLAKRAAAAEKFLAMAASDPTGEVRSQVSLNEIRYKKRKAKNQRDYARRKLL